MSIIVVLVDNRGYELSIGIIRLTHPEKIHSNIEYIQAEMELIEKIPYPIIY
jgi:hypothetical protein